MRFVSPHRSIIGAAVATDPDATYQKAWLTDGLPNFPSKTTGNMSHTITPIAPLDIDVIAITHHAVKPAATITLGSGLGTIPTAAWQSDDIPLNFVKVHAAPVTAVSSFTLSITGNTTPVIVGELFAGLSTVFPQFLQNPARRYTPQRSFSWEGEYASLAPPDHRSAKQRRVRGVLLLTDAQVAALDEIHTAQRVGHLPVLWVEYDSVNDPWLCQFDFDVDRTEGKNWASVELVEIPRFGW